MTAESGAAKSGDCVLVRVQLEAQDRDDLLQYAALIGCSPPEAARRWILEGARVHRTHGWPFQPTRADRVFVRTIMVPLAPHEAALVESIRRAAGEIDLELVLRELLYFGSLWTWPADRDDIVMHSLVQEPFGIQPLRSPR